MNINRDYLIKVDRKSGSVDIPNAMSFCITDIKTSNIFCQLVTNESSSELVKKYSPVENAENYEILLRVIKANNEPKELQFTLVDELDAFFMIDLTEDLKDYVGKYKCELFVDCMVNGELERITSSAFTYSVRDSIMNSLDEVIEGDPDYPLVDKILEELETVDLTNYATNESVDEAVANKADIEHVHSNYAIAANVSMSLATKASIDHTHDNYVTDFKFNTSLAGKASKDHTHDDYATEEYVNNAIANIETQKPNYDIDLSPYATIKYVDESIANACDDSELKGLISKKAPIVSPNFTGSISLGRKEDTGVGLNSTALGYDVTATGEGSHAEGQGTTASAYVAHAEGGFTEASGMFSHAEGQGTTASSYCSHSEGGWTTASGMFSHAEGGGTIAASTHQHVQGLNNIEDTEGRYAHIVGNGFYERANAHTLDWQGNGWYAGNLYVGGESQDDAKKVATESYVNEALSNVSGGSGACNITVIGGQEETHIFTPDDVPDNSDSVYLLKNVEVNGSTHIEVLMAINTWTVDDNVKCIEMIDTWGNCMCFYTDENGELVLEDDYYFVQSGELELYADKEYVDSLIGDIEAALSAILGGEDNE